MEPSVSIHHFVHPAWFEELGGWTKEANIHLFVNFAVEAFKRFGQHAKLWSSFNEPTVTAHPICIFYFSVWSHLAICWSVTSPSGGYLAVMPVHDVSP